MRVRLLLLAILLTAVAATISAEVVQVTANGCLLRQEVAIKAPPAAVWAVLTGKVGSWWNPAHTYSGDSANLSIDARPGGCFCERLPNGGGVEHMRIVNVLPLKMLRMAGALGPFQSSGVAGSMTWELLPVEGGTTLRLTYSVGGFMPGGFEKIAPAADGVLGDQVQRLKRFVETGKP